MNAAAANHPVASAVPAGITHHAFAPKHRLLSRRLSDRNHASRGGDTYIQQQDKILFCQPDN